MNPTEVNSGSFGLAQFYTSACRSGMIVCCSFLKRIGFLDMMIGKMPRALAQFASMQFA